MHPTECMVSWTHSTRHHKLHLDRCFCTAHGRQSPCFTMGSHFPLKLAHRVGHLDPHLMLGSLGELQSTSRTASRSVQPFCRTRDRDRQTDIQTDGQTAYSVYSNTLHLHGAAMRPLLAPACWLILLKCFCNDLCHT